MYHLPSYSRFFVQVTPDEFSKLLPIAVFAHQPTLISPARREDRQGICRCDSGDPGGILRSIPRRFAHSVRSASSAAGRTREGPGSIGHWPCIPSHPGRRDADRTGATVNPPAAWPVRTAPTRMFAPRWPCAAPFLRAATRIESAFVPRWGRWWLQTWLWVVANVALGGSKRGSVWSQTWLCVVPRFSMCLFHHDFANPCSPAP